MNFPNKKYNIIYADPPWSFKNKGKSLNGVADSHYDTMTIKNIKALPVEEIAADDCALVMWWVSAMPQEALDVVTSWGFTIKKMNGFIWHKMTKKNLTHFGMGFYTRAGAESALIAIRGKPEVVSHSVRDIRQEQVLKHSEKPHAFREDIVQLFGDKPRIELFARKTAEGWDSWGNENHKEVSFL